MKRWIYASLACGLLLGLLGGCGANQSAETPEIRDSQTNPGGAQLQTTGQEPSDANDEQKTKGEPTFAPSDVDPRVAAANNAFAFELFRTVADREEKGKNVFLSPASATFALAMTMNGAAGETMNGMKQALRMDDIAMEDVNRSLQALADLLQHSGDGIRLDIANSLWADEGLAFHEPFLQANETFYDAETNAVDLQSPEAAARINSWVSERTEGKIDKLLEEPLSGDAILLLLNAIYFDASWEKPFAEDSTAPHPFRLADGTAEEVPTMFRHGKLRYADGDGFEAVHLPYVGGQLGMYVFAPDEGTDVSSLVDRLTQNTWKQWKSSFEDASGRLGLPKFRVEYETSLNEPLKALGMESAFDPNNADFGGMIDLPLNVYVSQVTQKTYVDVAEQGTVAAAVTGVTMEVASAPSKTFDLVVDRPFLFVIHDARTDAILFLGTIHDPA